MEKIEYNIHIQNGLETIYTVPILKKEIANDIMTITLKKGTSYTGATFYNIYRGKKMVKQFYGKDSEDKAFAYIAKLKAIHSDESI